MAGPITLAFRYLELGLPLVLLRPESKRPIADPESGSWWAISDPKTLSAALRIHPRANFALRCEGIVQIDADSDEALEWARLRGLRSESSWVLRTGRGWRVFYRAPDQNLVTYTDPSHKTPDLLAPCHLAVVPPSIHPNGRPYTWIPLHSPLDIAIDELAPLPGSILAAWMMFKSTNASSMQRIDTPDWLGLVFDAICDYLATKGHRLRQRGDGGIIANCPFHHDRNPSLSIHPWRGWKCFAGCGEGRLTNLAARLGIRVREGVNP